MSTTSPRSVTRTATALFAFVLLAASAAPQPAVQKHAVTGVSTTTVLTITTGLQIPYGLNVDGIAQVTAADSSPFTGNITFYDGATAICTISVVGSSGCPASAGSGFAAGRHNLTAIYAGDATHVASTSNLVTVTVVPDVTTASLTSSLNPASPGQSITLTATLTGDTVTPTGSVTFLDSGAILGAATLDATSHATFTTSTLTAGTHSLTVAYTATQNFLGSASPTLSQIINAPTTTTASPSFVIAAGPSSVSTGASTNVLVKVSPLNGFNQPVQLKCANLPEETTCTFAATTIPTGGGATTLKLTTQAPRTCGSSTPYGQTASGTTTSLSHAASTLAASALVGPSLAGLFLFLLPHRLRPRHRRALKSLLTLIAMAGTITAMTGCGTCTDLGTRPGTYTIQVTGTSMGATLVTVTQNIQITVTE